MHRTARTLAATLPALLVVAAAWLRLEHPLSPLWRPAVLLALALGAAAPPRWVWRSVAAIVATVLAGWVAVGVWLVPSHPLDPGSAFGLSAPLSSLGTAFGNGFSDFYGTHLPFDPRVDARMSALVLAAIFCFSLLIALLAAARLPVWAALAVIAGAGWPATLLGPSHGILIGAAILGAELALFAGLGSRRVPVLALPATAVVAVAAIAVGSATAARHGLLRWETWNPTHTAGPVGVSFVWNAQYGGLRWPRRRTVVLDVQAPQRPSYMRAAVLDDFSGDAWSLGAPRSADALEPPAALRRANETREVVTVQGLADTRLPGGSIPVRFAPGAAPVTQPERGFAYLPAGLTRGFRYRVWSYAPQPTASDLRRAPPTYPSVLVREGLLDVGGGLRLPAFGTQHRAALLQSLLSHDPAQDPYLPLVRLAEQVTRGARTPYGAVADLERWFLVSGHFRYTNEPLVIGPPLVGFVTETRAGYCQFFAGAMALMLRYLGIPARVAVGFAGGTYDPAQRTWLLSDHDAHAWVEAWFKGYGWLPFDPTPATSFSTRNPLPAAVAPAHGATGESSPSPGVLAQVAATIGSPHPLTAKGGAGSGGAAGAQTPAAGRTSSGALGRGMFVLLLLLVLAAAAGGIALTKTGLRTARRRSRDPRRIAAACREELAGFLADQRIDAAGSATLHELGDLVRREFGIKADGFVTAATAARFGRADHAGAAAREARGELRNLLEMLRHSLTRRERLRGLLSLRSLGRRPGAVGWSASLKSGMAGSTGS